MLADGSRRPASTLNGEPAPSKRCSIRMVGVHVHKFPADANPGTATDMYVVGMFGEKNGVSSPATTDVLFQSKRRRMIRKLAIPEVVALYPLGSPPKNPICSSALVRAPKTSGPIPVSPTIDCRTDAPSPPEGYPANFGTEIDGTSRLSTLPELAKALNSAMPESFKRNLDPLSTLVCRCSSTRAFSRSQSSCEICAAGCAPSGPGGPDATPVPALAACPGNADAAPSMRLNTSPNMAR